MTFNSLQKELILSRKLKFSNLYISATRWLNTKLKLVYQTKFHSLKYLRFKILGCKYIGIRKSDSIPMPEFILNNNC